MVRSDPRPGHPGDRRPLVLRLLAGLLVLAAVVAAARFHLAFAGSGVGQFDSVARFLLAVAVIVFVSHLLGALFEHVHQPPVLGEIIGGLLLGPSALAALWPQASAVLFTKEVVGALGMIAQLGLVTFLFLLGCELGRDIWSSRRPVAMISLGSIGLPFVGGIAVALAGQDVLAGPSQSRVAYLVFFGVAVSITALPVLARILVDLDLTDTRTGSLALACAAFGDGLVWVVLTVVLGLTSPEGIITTVGLALLLVLVTMLVVRPWLAALARHADARPASAQFLLPVLLSGALGSAAITNVIGLHPALGAFLFGLAVPRAAPAVERIKLQLQGFVITVLLPLFFAGIGLTTSVRLIGGSIALWCLFGALLLTAVVGKLVGAAGGARLAGLPPRESLRIGALMNCRGVTELVVAAIGYQYHLISALGLTMLALVAVITTAATGPLIHRIG